MNFDIFVHICAPISGLLFSLGIGVEMVQEGLHAALIFDIDEAGFKIRGEI